jgi:hypothetical protein
MSFFDLSDGKTVSAATSFDSNVQIKPIPANTQVIAAIDEIKWDEYQGDSFVSARWVVLDGEHKGRKIFHKIRVKEQDKTKRDRALKMLAAIDANAGGDLMRNGTEPGDSQLSSALSNKPMAIKLGLWEIDDKSGNWVMAVSPVNSVSTLPTPVAATADDIPF